MESETRLGSGGADFELNPRIDYREVVERSIRRAHELRDDKVRTLGRLVKVLRERQDMTREQVAQRSRLNPQWVAMLEWELCVESDISKARLRRLGRALKVPGHSDVALAEASGLSYSEIPERARPLKPDFRVTR